MSTMNHPAVMEARRWIGTPFLHQASMMGAGCDCLGLVRGVWREILGPEPAQPPPYRTDWMIHARGEPLLELARRFFLPCGAVQEGALLVFRWREGQAASHLAIASSTAWMIHAHEGRCVAEVALTPAWRRRIVGCFMFPAGPRESY